MYVASHPLRFEPGVGYFAVEGPMPHECPEAYPRETAEMMASFHSLTGIPVSPRTKARIQMGLASGLR